MCMLYVKMLLLIYNYLAYVLLTCCVFWLSSAWAQQLPEVPCPQYFGYFYERGRYYGKFTMPILTNKYTKLDIQFSQKTPILNDYYGNITVMEETTDVRIGHPVTYRVHFPIPNEIPKLERLTINNMDICISKDYEFLPDNIQTIYLQHNLTVSLTHMPPPFVRRPTGTTNNPYATNIQYESPVPTLTSQQPQFTLLPSRNAANVQFITVPSTAQPSQRPQNGFGTLPVNRNAGLPTRNTPRALDIDNVDSSQFVPIEPNTLANDQRGSDFNRPFRNFASAQQSQAQLLPTPRPTLPTRRRQLSGPATPNPAEQRIDLSETCGRQVVQFSPYIFGGENLTRGQFPWLTPIYRKQLDGLQFLCGGSLISTRTIITAGHCVSNYLELTADQMVAYVGRYNLQDYGEKGSQAHELTRFVLHPDYNVTTISDADIALLLLRDAVSFTNFIQPVCLWREPDDISLIANELGYIAGWGADERRRPITNLPKMVTSRIFSFLECRRSPAYENIITNRTICAGNSDGSGPCQGDSGGGLLISRNGRWVLRGILSGGATVARLCELNKFVIYCDIAKHINWVLQNMIP